MGGALILTDIPLVAGDEVWLRIEPGLATQAEMHASVISLRRRDADALVEYGLRLVESSMDNARALERYIRRHLSHPQSTSA